MNNYQYKIKAEVWLYPGMAAWHFVTLPEKESEQIKTIYGGLKKGWGSLPVKVIVGKTTWFTSIFPDKKANAYLLPLKSEIRKKENIVAGDKITLCIEIFFESNLKRV